MLMTDDFGTPISVAERLRLVGESRRDLHHLNFRRGSFRSRIGAQSRAR